MCCCKGVSHRDGRDDEIKIKRSPVCREELHRPLEQPPDATPWVAPGTAVVAYGSTWCADIGFARTRTTTVGTATECSSPDRRARLRRCRNARALAKWRRAHVGEFDVGGGTYVDESSRVESPSGTSREAVSFKERTIEAADLSKLDIGSRRRTRLSRQLNVMHRLTGDCQSLLLLMLLLWARACQSRKWTPRMTMKIRRFRQLRPHACVRYCILLIPQTKR